MIPLIDAFIICWNEERIIRHTLNHYSSFCSKITLLDNCSSDNTRDLVKKYFPQVEIVDFDTKNEHREDVLLELKNNFWKKSNADYVIVCDTDEFLYSENMQDNLIKLSAGRIILPLIIGFNMGSLEFPENYDIPIFDQVGKGVRDRGFDKQIIFSRRGVSEINYEMGAHSCFPQFKESALVDEVVFFKLLHYKFLSKEYLYKKHAAYDSRLSEFDKKNKIGSAYTEGAEYIDKSYKWLEKHLYKVI